MKKSEKFINDRVFKTNLKYTRLQNETKELFFRCLDEGRSEKYFEKQLNKIWDNVDHSFMDKDIEEYKQIIHDNNLQLFELAIPKTEKEVKKENSFFDIISAVVIIGYEKKYVRQQEKEYRRVLKSPLYMTQKDYYLPMLAMKKDIDINRGIVPYYVKKTGKIREVQLSTYASMIHNTNLTRAAWNQTLNDADEFKIDKFYIPFHNFSCPDCVEHQNKVMTREEVESLIDDVSNGKIGNVLHPNCKCVLVPYYPGLTNMSGMPLKRNEETGKYETNYAKLHEQYDIRQKVNTLTLEKERLLTDKRILENMGSGAKRKEYQKTQRELRQQGYKATDSSRLAEVNKALRELKSDSSIARIDEINQRIRNINSQINGLKQELPTEELQKQVVAINRNYNSSYY